MKHKIKETTKRSIAHELEIQTGDFLLSINNKPIADIIDYRTMTASRHLLLEIEKHDGEIWELDIEKDPDEDLGLIFYEPLMSKMMLCRNKCIFCFVDQEPNGLRKSLYVKDDDWRMSFFHGNFITLTNLSNPEIDRICSMHLSPLYISVHTTDMETRKMMMGSDNAGNLFRCINKFSGAGILMHFQVVLCKGINDGQNIIDTVTALENIRGSESLAIVPAGLTRHRGNLYNLTNFTADDAKNIIHEASNLQKSFKKKRGSSFVYLSDEWYIKANVPLPAYKTYGLFPQLSNGVGMAKLFEKEFLQGLKKLSCTDGSANICIVTGMLAFDFMQSLARLFAAKFPGAKLTVYPITNFFYGSTVTVSGLLTGHDIINQFSGNASGNAYNAVFLPYNAFKNGTDIMLDDLSLKDLTKHLKVKILIGNQHGGIFAKQLHEELLCLNYAYLKMTI